MYTYTLHAQTDKCMHVQACTSLKREAAKCDVSDASAFRGVQLAMRMTTIIGVCDVRCTCACVCVCVETRRASRNNGALIVSPMNGPVIEFPPIRIHIQRERKRERETRVVRNIAAFSRVFALTDIKTQCNKELDT